MKYTGHLVMRVTLKLFLALILLPVTMPAQTTSYDWVEALGDPAVVTLVDRIEEEEAALPPLSPLSEAWLASVAELGERVIEAGVHRSDSRYQGCAAYLYERADWAGLPAERIKRFREESERLIAAVAGGPGELAVTATLLGAAEGAIEAGEAPESGALDALRRTEVELLTRGSLEERARAGERIAAGTALVVEMEDALSAADAPPWSNVAAIIRDASAAVTELTDGAVSGRGPEPLILYSPEPRVGIPEREILRVLGNATPSVLELALRWDGEIALGSSLFFDRYRWTLAPLGDAARLGAQMFVLEEKQRELYNRLFEGRLERRRESVRLSREERASEELRQELLREAEGVLRRFEERARRGDSESERWALLSVLSHPYAQTLLFGEGEPEFRERLRRKVRELYEEVDGRARELVGLVARRHAVTDWDYLVTPIPNSFDRIVTVRFLPNEGVEPGAEVTQQLADAYYRAFNLVTNPEQNQDGPGQGVARWSMLHGQYLETLELGGDAADSSDRQSFREVLAPWFLEAEREIEPRAAFPFFFRGYQRLRFEQESWLASTGERLPRRMAPLPTPELLLAADLADSFISGESSLYATERLLSYVLEAEMLPAQFAWAEALEGAKSWHSRTSRAETTTALLSLLSEREGLPGQYAALTAVLESRLRRVLLIQDLDLLDESISLDEVYGRWMENAASLLLGDAEAESSPAGEARMRRSLMLPEEWQQRGLLQRPAAERFYRVLSREATSLLTTREAEREADDE